MQQGPIVPQQQQQTRQQIYIDNLDQGITEDYLYHKFKEVGSIQSLKILKEKSSQKSRGQAYITFGNPDSAEEARRRFDNQVFIKNAIRVKPYINISNVDKQANIFINNLPESTDVKELEQIFSEYGNVQSLEIKQDANTGKSLGYGYIQFEKKDDVDKLMDVHGKEGLEMKGKTVRIERFKAQTERKTESMAVYLRALARPLLGEEMKNDKIVKAYEQGWKLLLKHNFESKNIAVKDCFARFDASSGQPWAMVQFVNGDEVKRTLEECETSRTHFSIHGSADQVFQLIQKNSLPVNSDGSKQFEVKDVQEWFQNLAKDPNDPYKGNSDNFFFNQMTSKHLNQDERLVLVQNIREDVTKEVLEEFLSSFGRFVRLTIRTNRHPKFKLKQCYVHYQTLEDSKNARSEIYSNPGLDEQKRKIFENNKPFATILMPKSIRKEFKQIKTQSQSQMFPPMAQRKILMPAWQQPMMQPHQFQGMPQFRPQQQYGPQQPYGQPRPQNFDMRGGQPGPQRPYNPNRGGQPNYQRPPHQQQHMRQGQGHQMGQPPHFAGIPQPAMHQQAMHQQYRQPQAPFQQHQPQFQQYPNQMPMVIPQQLMPQQRVLAPQPMVPRQPQFSDYQQIKTNMQLFSSLSPQEQRQILGQLLSKQIANECPLQHKQYVGKMTGMLMDEEQFEIEDIINFLEDKDELIERVHEAIELITGTDNSQPQQ